MSVPESGLVSWKFGLAPGHCDGWPLVFLRTMAPGGSSERIVGFVNQRPVRLPASARASSLDCELRSLSGCATSPVSGSSHTHLPLRSQPRSKEP